MRAMVQMYLFGEECVFVAVTEADHSGRFRMLAWGDGRVIDIPFRTAEECDEHFLKSNRYMAGQVDGPAVTTAVPPIEAGEHYDDWLQRAMKSMEYQAMEHLMARLG